VTPRHWSDTPGASRWSTETLRREIRESKAEKRAEFALWASIVGGTLALVVLAVLERI
jgi:hypothetical protein